MAIADPCMNTLNASLRRVVLRIRFQPACMTAETRMSRSASVGMPYGTAARGPASTGPGPGAVDLRQCANVLPARKWMLRETDVPACVARGKKDGHSRERADRRPPGCRRRVAGRDDLPYRRRRPRFQEERGVVPERVPSGAD